MRRSTTRAALLSCCPEVKRSRQTWSAVIRPPMWLFCWLIVPIPHRLPSNPHRCRPALSHGPSAPCRGHRSPHSVRSHTSAQPGAAFAGARSTQESNLTCPCVAPAKAAWRSTLPAALSAWWCSDRDDGCLSSPRPPSSALPPRWRLMEKSPAATWGSAVKLALRRGGEPVEVHLTLSERPET